MRRPSSPNAFRRPARRPLVGHIVVLAGFFALLAAARSDDTADYLARHQGDLKPFFQEHGAVILKNCLPSLVAVAGNLLLLNALFGWLIDVPLSWGFSTIFAPAYAKFSRALIYASGRLVLALLFSVVLSFSALVGLNAGAGLPALLIVAVLTVPAIVLQVCWVSNRYHTGPQPSLLFYAVLLLVHGLALTVLASTLFSSPINAAVAATMNQGVVPELQAQAARDHTDAGTAIAKRDGIQTEVTLLQDRIARDKTEEADLQRTLAAHADAPAAVFSRLVLQRAQGDLAGAARGLADFIHRYPSDSRADAARAQLTAVNQALAAQLTRDREQTAANSAAVARDRSRLLAHLAAGQATLSEMRRALLGRSTAEVAALLGPPSATEADRWGYGRRMIVAPQGSGSLGLAVVFSEGLVQGVDYYYGAGP